MKKLTATVFALILAVTLSLGAFADNDKKAQMFQDFLMNHFAANLEPDTPLWSNDVFLINLICTNKVYFNSNIAPAIEITGDNTLLINWLGVESTAFGFLFWTEEIWILQRALDEGVVSPNFSFEVTTDGEIIKVDGKSYREILVLLGLEEPEKPEENSGYTDIHEPLIVIIAALGFISGTLLFRHLRK